MKPNIHKSNERLSGYWWLFNYLHFCSFLGRGFFHHINLPQEQAKGSGSLLMNSSVRKHCYCHYEVFTSWWEAIRVCCRCSWRRCWRHWTWCQVSWAEIISLTSLRRRRSWKCLCLLHCLALDVDNLSNDVCRPVREVICEQRLGFRGQVVVWAVPVDCLVMPCLV